MVNLLECAHNTFKNIYFDKEMALQVRSFCFKEKVLGSGKKIGIVPFRLTN